MNENIDLTKILKDCPIGWEFYSSIYGYVIFHRIENSSEYPVKFFYIDKNNSKNYGSVTKQGLHVFYFNGECTLFPSKEQRDWSKFTAPWYKKPKFDPKTLKPFDRVLVRDNNDNKWECSLFSRIIKYESFPFKCVSSAFRYCIPYNDDTKYLIGTTDEAPEYYRYWED